MGKNKITKLFKNMDHLNKFKKLVIMVTRSDLVRIVFRSDLVRIVFLTVRFELF